VRLSFFGHTHRAAIHEARVGALISREAKGETVISDGAWYLVNPGSVGQPRDGDPRAAYAIFDARTGAIDFRRVAFDHAACLAKAAAAGLAAAPAPRLGVARRLVALARRFA
jgi:diadenosine tetraphosphatase ApaH/serine/threonine PP2A family protein phosphatase